MKLIKHFGLIPLVIIILFSILYGCNQEEISPPPSITITATLDSVDFLTGSSIIHWKCIGASECFQVTRFGNAYVQLAGYLELSQLKADTTITLSCSGPGGIASKSITISVKERSLYYKNIDILTSGRWKQTNIKMYWDPELGMGSGILRWDSYPPPYRIELTFYKNYDYSELLYEMKYEKQPTSNISEKFWISNDGKLLQLWSWYPPTEVRTLTNDSLVIYHLGHWFDTDGHDGYDPTILSYKHLFD